VATWLLSPLTANAQPSVRTDGLVDKVKAYPVALTLVVATISSPLPVSSSTRNWSDVSVPACAVATASWNTVQTVNVSVALNPPTLWQNVSAVTAVLMVVELANTEVITPSTAKPVVMLSLPVVAGNSSKSREAPVDKVPDTQNQRLLG
jgi:hypothetical protein